MIAQLTGTANYCFRISSQNWEVKTSPPRQET